MNTIRTTLLILIVAGLSCTNGIAKNITSNPDTSRVVVNSELLNILLENGTITREQYNNLTRSSDRDPSLDLLDQEDDTGYSPAEIRTRRFRVQSEDGRDLFRIRGRLYVDGAGLFLNDNKNTVDDSRDGRGDLSNYGSIIRNARLGAEGVMYEDYLWRLEADFRDEEVRLRGAYIEYIRLNPLRISAGNIKEPMGMEWMTSRRRTTFLERAPSLDAYKPSWNIGLRAEYRGSSYNVMGALMSGGELFRERDVTGGYAVAGRVSYSPFNRGRTYTHLALSGSYRVNAYTQRIDNQFNRQYQDIRLRTRIGTRAIDGRFIGREDVQDTVDWTRLNAEVAFGTGPLSFQGELTSVNMNRDFQQSSLSLGGYYAQVSYFLTGESRSYRPGRGNIGALIPNRNFRPGYGPGAIEIAARFSRVDSIDQDYDGGMMDHFTLGLNWYLNREVRFMVNYIYLDAERMNGKQSTGSVLAGRFQIEF